MAHAPSEPSRAQLAPPSAKMVQAGRRVCCPWAVSNTRAPSLRPCQRQLVACVTPNVSKRLSHARSRGEAFIALGKTRPVLPVKMGWPRDCAHACTSGGPNSASIGLSHEAAWPYWAMKSVSGSSFVRFRPDLPAIRNLRPMLGLPSITCTRWLALASVSAAISPAGPAPITSASGDIGVGICI